MGKTVYIFVVTFLMACCRQSAYASVRTFHSMIVDDVEYYLYPDNYEAELHRVNSTWNSNGGVLTIASEIKYDGTVYTVKSFNWSSVSGVNIRKIRIPKTIEGIPYRNLSDPKPTIGMDSSCVNPFAQCYNLEAIEVDEDNPYFKSVDGVLYNKEMTELYSYPQGKNAQLYVVPEGVTGLAYFVFASNNFLRSIVLPETITMLVEGLPFGEEMMRSLESLVIKGILDELSMSKFFYGILNDNKRTAVYVQASEIDRYKEVYPGPVFSLEEYHFVSTGVKLLNRHSDESGKTIYNLSGQRMMSLQKGQLYIRQGKKLLVP